MKPCAFTLVELMIVVVIVAVLAMVTMPLLVEHVKASKMSEGIAAVGTIRTAFREYAAVHSGQYPALAGVDGGGLDVLNLRNTDIDGKHFANADYVVNSTDSTYTIRCTLPEDADYWWQVDEAGNVTKSGF
jgi:prepilin-type N-terminal cleavage/methylation domain-containing protein